MTPSSANAGWLLLLGVALLTITMLRILRRRQRKRSRSAALAIAQQGRVVSNSAAAEKTAALQTQHVELHESTREMMAQLDNKIVMLQQLIAEANAKIAELRHATQPTHPPAPQVRKSA